MATRPPRTNGRLVWVALDDVHPGLRYRVAVKLMDYEQHPEARALLLAAAVQPGRQPDGRPYGAWVSPDDKARVVRGVLPRG